jgi:hypothetical protein
MVAFRGSQWSRRIELDPVGAPSRDTGSKRNPDRLSKSESQAIVRSPPPANPSGSRGRTRFERSLHIPRRGFCLLVDYLTDLLAYRKCQIGHRTLDARKHRDVLSRILKTHMRRVEVGLDLASFQDVPDSLPEDCPQRSWQASPEVRENPPSMLPFPFSCIHLCTHNVPL